MAKVLLVVGIVGSIIACIVYQSGPSSGPDTSQKNLKSLASKMKSAMDHRPLVVWLLIILQFLLGFGAFVSGGLLVAAPDGSVMHMPLSMLQYSPFSNFPDTGIDPDTFAGWNHVSL